MKAEKVSTFLQSRIDAKDFPSAVYLVAEKGEIVFEDALGFAVVEPEKIEANLDTIYDLASLTKPLVTGLLCAKLIESGEICLSDKIGDYFAEFETNEKQKITIENLLTHTSGFQSWFPFYLFDNLKEEKTSKETVIHEVSTQMLENPINSKVVYSDYNFLILGFLLEQIYQRTLNEIAISEIFQPLNLRRTFFNPPKKLQKEMSANEFGNYYEKKMCLELGYFNSFYDQRDYKLARESGTDVMNYKWRDYEIWGEVHDANCLFMNGASGHAGLFSTAKETFKIAQQFLAEETVLLQPETCKLFRTNYTENFNEARSIAFQLAATKDSTASDALAKDSFGHLGFTGTSLWIEPETERIFILLTNRTHARDLPFANIHDTRRAFHELAAAILDERK